MQTGMISATTAAATTSTAAIEILFGQITTIQTQLASPKTDRDILLNAIVTGSLIVAMLTCTLIIIIAAGIRIVSVRSRIDSPRATPARSLTAGY